VNAAEVLALLEAVRDGRTSPASALERLKHLPSQAVGQMVLDTHRALRKGAGEVVYGEGKTPEQLKAIVAHHRREGLPFLITRLAPGRWKELRLRGRDLRYHPVARILQGGEARSRLANRGKIAIITAGASDMPVAEEVRIVLEFFGQEVSAFHDRGVAGLHRLMEHVDELRTARVIVAVAGMEGALPSVVAGLFEAPVIGVPTSVGYGSNLGGIAPLLTMLNSCTAGVAVVGIDNGVAAATLATLMNRP
jgi:hypothetical protein